MTPNKLQVETLLSMYNQLYNSDVQIDSTNVLVDRIFLKRYPDQFHCLAMVSQPLEAVTRAFNYTNQLERSNKGLMNDLAAAK